MDRLDRIVITDTGGRMCLNNFVYLKGTLCVISVLWAIYKHVFMSEFKD